MALSKAKLRRILQPADLVVVVLVLKRFLGKDKGIMAFLNKIDDPAEIDKLYDAILTLVNLVEKTEEPAVVEEVEEV